MTKRTCFLAAVAAVALAVTTSAPHAWPGLIVHEWGTFLAMNGSDGVSLDGMYHEEHALPPFVHARSRDQLHLPSSLVKGETPVIYFYTEVPARVQVRVDFPDGMWTQWYPQASMVGPGLAQLSTPLAPRNGRIQWDADVVPPDTARVRLPAAADAALWNHSRDVDAAYVSTVNRAGGGASPEWERFLFYRGLGQAKLPFDVRVEGGRLAADATLPEGVEHVFAIHVGNGRGAFSYTRRVTPGVAMDTPIPALRDGLPLEAFAERLADVVAARLVESGLYEKEARAMVNTWRTSYFTTDGVRVLFVLPQAWTDRAIPLRIKPTPAQVVRVMVGRIEVLTPARERRAAAAVRDLASPDAQVRAGAFEALRQEGRYVEPIVRRTLRTTSDERVRELCRRLLLTDFVTELRSSLTTATTGEKAAVDTVYVRAQLASLLREIGLADEARQEAAAVLAQLERDAPPRLDNHQSRHAYRALARANEGAGNDRAALSWYGEFVRFGSQSARCSGCHSEEGPRDMTFFRDWWAGRRFAEVAARAGERDRLIAAHESELAADPRNAAALLSLAYLYEERGDTARAQALWGRLLGG